MALSEYPIQQLADWVGDREEDDEEYPDNGRRLGPDAEPVARADGLRHDLTEGEDERDGDEDGAEGRDERVQKYRQRLHGEGVADEEGAEEQVLVLDDRQDPGGVVLVRRGAGLGEDLEVDEAEGHEPQGEPRHEPREEHQHHDDHHVLEEGRPAAVVLHRHPPPTPTPLPPYYSPSLPRSRRTTASSSLLSRSPEPAAPALFSGEGEREGRRVVCAARASWARRDFGREEK